MSEAEEAALAASLAMLELKPFEFHGHLGNRRVASFGLRYDYSLRSVETEENRWVRMSHRVLPRSIYILEGEARTMWEHITLRSESKLPYWNILSRIRFRFLSVCL